MTHEEYLNKLKSLQKTSHSSNELLVGHEWLLCDLLYNSGFELALYRIENLSIYSIIAFFLIMTWFLAFILFRDKCITLLKYSFNWHQVILSAVS